MQSQYEMELLVDSQQFIVESFMLLTVDCKLSRPIDIEPTSTQAA